MQPQHPSEPDPVLVLRHEPFEHLGYFAQILREHNISFIYRDLDDPVPEWDYSRLVIMGGPQSANDPLAGLAQELRLIESAIGQGKPVLGICLGAQLIAKSLGSRVYKNPVKEIGWAPVRFTADAEGDPVLGGLASPSQFFHWHGETFDLPPGATWLAYSENCRQQAFRHGGNVYGLQFHPEITPEMIVDWCDQPVNCGDFQALSAPIDAHAFDTAGLAKRVLEGWLSLPVPATRR